MVDLFDKIFSMKHSYIFILAFLVSAFCLITGCSKDGSGKIEAAIGKPCSTTLNFQGTDVYAENSTFGGADVILAGGYAIINGIKGELGVNLNANANGSYPANGSATPGSGAVFFQPDDNTTSKEYGSTSGLITLKGVSYLNDGVTIKGVELEMVNVNVVYYGGGTPDSLCIDQVYLLVQ